MRDAIWSRPLSLLLPLSLAAMIVLELAALESLGAGNPLPRFQPRYTAKCMTCRPEPTGLPFPIPVRGMVMAQSSIFWAFGDFTVVDLDQKMIATIETDRGDDGNLVIRRKVSLPLKNSQLRQIIDQANRVWNPPHAVPHDRVFLTIDMTGSISLYDHEQSFNANLYFPRDEFVTALSATLNAVAPRLPPDTAGRNLRGHDAPPNRSDVSMVVNPKPLMIVRPDYPAKAESSNVEGYVDFEFTIEPDGSVGDPKVVSEIPQGYGFAASAEAVFPRWKFSPRLVAGKPVPISARYRFSFRSPN
jgi:TonB family protein